MLPTPNVVTSTEAPAARDVDDVAPLVTAEGRLAAARQLGLETWMPPRGASLSSLTSIGKQLSQEANTAGWVC
jgi:hypothetical protein